jgi:hypothetical protein
VEIRRQQVARFPVGQRFGAGDLADLLTGAGQGVALAGKEQTGRAAVNRRARGGGIVGLDIDQFGHQFAGFDAGSDLVPPGDNARPGSVQRIHALQRRRLAGRIDKRPRIALDDAAAHEEAEKAGGVAFGEIVHDVVMAAQLHCCRKTAVGQRLVQAEPLPDPEPGRRIGGIERKIVGIVLQQDDGRLQVAGQQHHLVAMALVGIEMHLGHAVAVDGENHVGAGRQRK